MKLLRSFFRNAPKYFAWLVVSSLLWIWVFTFIRDTVPEKKVVLLADVYAMNEQELSICLEEAKPEGIRMVRAHTFNYATFNSTALENGDIYIVPEADISTYLSNFIPLDVQFAQDLPYELYLSDGVPYGFQVYDTETGVGLAEDYIRYQIDEEPGQDYYLFFGGKSLHAGANDMAAYDVVCTLIEIN